MPCVWSSLRFAGNWRARAADEGRAGALLAQFVRSMKVLMALGDELSSGGDFQKSWVTLSCIQAASLMVAARVGSWLFGGLLIHTSSG